MSQDADTVAISDDLWAAAEWLAEIGYPFDWWNETLPPEPLQRAIEQAWVARDAGTHEEAKFIIQTVAEEGGWTAHNDGEADA